MVNVKNMAAAWEQRQPTLSVDLQQFLDLAWTHRKNQATGAYAANNADVYGLYARVQRNFGVNSGAMIEFLNGILAMPQLPEIQCDPEDEDDSLGDFLWTYFNAQKAPSGFAALDQQNFTALAALARNDTNVRTALSENFYHFRRNLNPSVERIYLHVKPLKALRVMQFLVTNMLRRPDLHPGLSNVKVGAPGVESRFDTIVIYLSGSAAVHNALDEIATYQNAGTRNLFNHGTTRSTKLISSHNGIQLVGVGTGAEPPVALYKHNQELVLIPGASSFGSFRSKLIQFALANTLQLGQGKPEFLERVIAYFKAAGIDPRFPHKHGNQSELRRRARITLQQLQWGIEPTRKVT